jgi:hypothetical protein
MEKELNSMLRKEAGANGVSYLNTYTPSIGHDACKGEGTRWIEPAIPQSDAFAVHPNELGMKADASELEASMRAKGL